VFNITTIGNIRRISGTGKASFYFKVYKRTSAGVETLIATSDNTIPVIDGGVYTEFSATAIWNDGIFLDTDRVVMKYYANRISGGSNPTYQFQFGGVTPVRTLVPIPLTVVPLLPIDAVPTDGSTNAVSSNGVFDALVIKENTANKQNSLTLDGTGVKFPTVDAVNNIVVKNIVSNALKGSDITGTVSETILYSKLIPANTFKNGDFLTLFSRIIKTGNLATLTQRVKINTSNTLTGSILIATNLLGFANKLGVISRTFNLDGNLIHGYIAITSNSTDILNTNSAIESNIFDPTIDNYIFITGQLSSAVDVMNVFGTKITN
jgi:hypothetical protein